MAENKPGMKDTFNLYSVPLLLGAALLFVVLQMGFQVKDLLLKPNMLSMIGFGIAIGNAVEKFSHPTAWILPLIFGVILFAGLFGLDAAIFTRMKGFPAVGILLIIIGGCIGYALAKGGL